MACKRFLQDLARATIKPIKQIEDIRRHEDSSVAFNFVYAQAGSIRRVPLICAPMNIDEYPEGSSYTVYTEEDNVDPVVLATLAQITPGLDGASIPSALHDISAALRTFYHAGTFDKTATTKGQCAKPSQADLGDESNDEDFEDAFDVDSDHDFDLFERCAAQTKPDARSAMEDYSAVAINKIKADLHGTKGAGFKVGVLGDLFHGGIVCVSVRVTKLGISEEAMQAWGISPKHYLVLLLRFQNGYKDLRQIKAASKPESHVQMRVGLCKTYKPSPAEASSAFGAINLTDTRQSTQAAHADRAAKLEPFFIGRPLNDLLRERLPAIIKFRALGMSWLGAETAYNDVQGQSMNELTSKLGEYLAMREDSSNRILEDIVTNDALETIGADEAPLPLVAMQFLLRHTVRCTEFCLVCHCKVDATFEALKPYVCGKPLCLYQFLALGMGPSVEWEIITQPYVVDLLVSLCYFQTQAGRLREFPHGIGLKVPLLPGFAVADFPSLLTAPRRPVIRHPERKQSIEVPPVAKPITRTCAGTFDEEKLFLVPDETCWDRATLPRAGEWLVILTAANEQCKRHYRVHNVLKPYIHLQPGPVLEPNAEEWDARLKSQPSTKAMVDCYFYCHDFDTLSESLQQRVILEVLDTLPPVSLLRNALLEQQANNRDPSLDQLTMVSSAAKDLLRWVIASNRSCIMQVDRVIDGQTPQQNRAPPEARVSGMDDWMQFRFAQGAPDKEQRFVDAVTAHSTSETYPTLFAWHGSPISNWHSIIRQGLHYDEIMHGRASGNGIYMARDVATSLGYTGALRGTSPAAGWKSSELDVSTVMSLQEVVNAPKSFVTTTPYFVVAQQDWVQTRYLFIKTKIKHTVRERDGLSYAQDPAWALTGNNREPVQIPLTAIPKSRRRSEVSHIAIGKKKRRTTPDSFSRDLVEGEDDTMSVSTLPEDQEWTDLEDDGYVSRAEVDDDQDVILIDADTFYQQAPHPRQDLSQPSDGGRKREHDETESRYILDTNKTDFQPGGLDTRNIRFLPPPAEPSTMATKSLMMAFKQTIQAQATVPLHDLGFYIDPDRVQNMYQWIVELHSFDQSLPLAKDMRQAGISSIVLEMRFPTSYPFEPPFVRVVKPRFLSFLRGGGGHVTEGGAICMELLTSDGWSPSNSIESILLQVRLALSETERPARLAAAASQKGHASSYRTNECYGIGEAVVAFERACIKHGWKKPPGLQAIQMTD